MFQFNHSKTIKKKGDCPFLILKSFLGKEIIGLFSKPGRWRRWINNSAGAIGIFRTDYLGENHASRDDGDNEFFDLLTPNSCAMKGSFADAICAISLCWVFNSQFQSTL